MRYALSLLLLATLTVAVTGCQPPQPRAPAGAAGASAPAAEWATPWPPQPRVRAGEAKAVMMPQVHTLAELKAQPPIRVSEDWQVRLGWDDPGPAAGPWKLVYCYAERKGRDADTKLSIFEGTEDQLGPMHYTVTDPDVRRRFASDEFSNVGVLKGSLGREGLFCRVVPAAWKGKYRIGVLCLGGDLDAAAMVFEVDQPEVCPWQEFAGINRDRAEGESWYRVALAPEAVYPQLNGHVRLWPLLPNVQEKVPAQTDKLSAVDPGGLTLMIEGRDFVVRSKPEVVTWLDMNVAARWWVNGKPITAQPMAAREKMARQLGRLVTYGTEMKAPMGLPRTLGALKAGDKIGLQVMYSPAWLEELPNQRHDMDMRQMIENTDARDGCRMILMSNRLEFTVEEWMLRGREVAPEVGSRQGLD